MTGLYPRPESFEVVRAVDDHRRFWKPRNVETLLLAESHVHTSDQELNVPLVDTDDIPRKCPRKYVRLIYCLAYGEDVLLEDRTLLKSNRGTWQFWKLFAACSSDSPYEIKTSIGRILKQETTDDVTRVRNKVVILNRLKAKGVWLLDASILALFVGGGKLPSGTMREIIEASWESYISETIEGENPRRIVVVGKGVYGILNKKLRTLGEQIGAKVHDPISQGPLPKQEHHRLLERCQRICNP